MNFFIFLNVKSFYQIVSSSLIVIGSVIGAGFISGREIVSFFSGTILIPSVYLTGLIFFFATLMLFRVGAAWGDEAVANKAIFGRFYPLLEGVILLSCFISFASMLAGLDALSESFWGRIPVFSVGGMIAATISLRRGIKGIAVVNFIMVPFMVGAVLYFLFEKGEFVVFSAEVSGTKDFKIVLYAAMNLFSASQVIISLGDKIDRKCQMISSLILSVILCFLIFLIAAAVAFEGANAKNADMPLLYLVSENKSFGIVFCVIVFFGIFTTLITSYYPLYRFARERKKSIGVIVVCFLSFLFSRIGLKAIVDYVYPVQGMMGLIYLVFCAVYTVRGERCKNKTLYRAL